MPNRRRSGLVCFLAAICLVAAPAGAQRNKNVAPRADKVLLAHWRTACERVRDGDPWSEIADGLQSAIDATDVDRVHPDISMYLDALRAAAREAGDLPQNRPGASPEELVSLLTQSHVIQGQRGFDGLLFAPLHVHAESSTVTRMHWNQLADQPEHEFTDPAIRVLHRERDIIPHLIAALDDRTATRCTFVRPATSTNPSDMYLRGELAMALLEALAKCRFYVSERYKRFVHHDDAKRREAIALAESWWQTASEMTPLDARSQLISRVAYEHAAEMINLLVIENHTERAVSHLRAFLIQDDGSVRLEAARSLVALGDQSPLAAIVRQVREEKKITDQEARLLVAEGGNREYRLLRELLGEGLEAVPGDQVIAARNILRGITLALESRMAIPLLAIALDPQDTTTIGTGVAREIQELLPDGGATRADLAAALIQQETRRNFRYDAEAEPEFRRKGIARIRDWWEREGSAVYRFENARSRRGDGIR